MPFVSIMAFVCLLFYDRYHLILKSYYYVFMVKYISREL